MNTATEKQKAFILTLAKERIAGEVEAEWINDHFHEMTTQQASKAIDYLLSCPKDKNAGFSNAHLDALPKARYAVPAFTAESALHDEKIKDSYVFFVVAEYMGTRYLRRLFGAPGDFTRHKMSYRDMAAAAKLLADDPIGYSKLFAQHYSVCGKCGAELTDEKSRKFGFGPDCRKELGIK